MPPLPPASDFTGSSRTEGQVKTAWTDTRAFQAGLLGEDGTPGAALAALGALLGAYAPRTAAGSVTAGDRGRLLHATGAGAWTLTLLPAATAGAGFSFAVLNGATGGITVDPNGSELIDGAATLPILAGDGRMIVSTGTEWLTFRLLGRDGVQQSATDATAGRLLRLDQVLGSFGLGAISPTTIANLDDTTLATGFYRTTAGGTTGGTWPPGWSAVTAALLVERTSTVSVKQTITRTTTVGGAWQRFWNGTVWSAWERPTPVLGTVTQSGGVPTGPIVEKGSNANGEYTRWADGTQVCWRSITLSAGAATTWTFPAAFAAAPSVSGTSIATVLSSLMLDAAPSATSCSLSTRDKTDARRGDVAHVQAKGRWFI